MTGYEIRELPFTHDGISTGIQEISRFQDWPVVYTLGSGRQVYVGESLHGARRMRQHRESPAKQHLRTIRLILDETFNKSACLDLESTLIRWLDGDGYEVINRNSGIVDSEYYQRPFYQQRFDEIFGQLRDLGVFQRSIRQIENSDLFKLSPFKSLNTDQASAVDAIMTGIVRDLEQGSGGLSVIQGEPGTGKTIVAIYLLKLLRDVAELPIDEEPDPDEMFSEHFQEETRELLQELRIGLVVPQSSLRRTIQKVFSTIPSLRGVPVLTPFQVGEAEEDFDLLIVDEAHRLNQLSAQPHPTQTNRFKAITTALFGELDPDKTQLDWIRARSRMTLIMLDTQQSVRPSDIPTAELQAVAAAAEADGRRYPLRTQMRAAGGSDYIRYIRQLLSANPPQTRLDFGDYEFAMFDDLGRMLTRIREQEAEHSLARLVAGFAWPWVSRSKDRQKKGWAPYDIEIDGLRLPWNRRPTDWINSATSAEEVGSIHTVQGYDLNYTGVIIGPDLRFDPVGQHLVADRAHYFDAVGKRSNGMRGQITTDEDLLRYITNVYSVLMTRGMRGTYLYVCDPALRQRLSRFVPSA